MIRFKVVRASRLALWAAALLLIGVVIALALRHAAAPAERSPGEAASLVESDVEDEAKTAQVFASSDESALDPAEGSLEIEVLPSSATRQAAPRKRVLIYHTHTHEAYEQVVDDPYHALEAWRTNDADHSVVRVGEELAQMLEMYGFDVVHDVTDHEGSELSTAYVRSLATLQSYKEPFDLYIDLHRDAYAQGMTLRHTSESGMDMAQLMMLIGNGVGFDEKPDYPANLAFAQTLTEAINALEPGLCKDVLVKDGRYNQHIGTPSILVEVGHNLNTLQEALNAIPYLANALHNLLIET